MVVGIRPFQTNTRARTIIGNTEAMKWCPLIKGLPRNEVPLLSQSSNPVQLQESNMCCVYVYIYTPISMHKHGYVYRTIFNILLLNMLNAVSVLVLCNILCAYLFIIFFVCYLLFKYALLSWYVRRVTFNLLSTSCRLYEPLSKYLYRISNYLLPGINHDYNGRRTFGSMLARKRLMYSRNTTLLYHRECN